MQRTIITVNTSEFLTPADTDRAELERQVIEAVRHNGDFIEIPRPGEPPLSVLVTPASTVIVLERVLPDNDVDGTSNDAADEFDLDLDLTPIELP